MVSELQIRIVALIKPKQNQLRRNVLRASQYHFLGTDTVHFVFLERSQSLWTGARYPTVPLLSINFVLA